MEELTVNKERHDQQLNKRRVKEFTPLPGRKCSQVKRGVLCTGNVSRTTKCCTKCGHLYLFKPQRRKKR